jgi:hypothetical protein
MTVRETRPGGIQVIASQSVSDTLGPPAPRGSVRARLVSGGGVILPAPDGGCDVMFMTQARGTRLAAASSPHVLCALTRTHIFRLALARLISEATCRPTWWRWWRAQARWRWRWRAKS